MNVRNIRHLWQLIISCTTISIVCANPAEHFLNSVIGELKHDQASSPGPHSLYDELFGTIGRSSEEFQNVEAQEPSENFLYEQNFGFDQSQNQIFKEFNALQNQANFAAGNPLNLDFSEGLLQQQQQQQQPPIIGLQQFNVNGYLNLPPPEEPAAVTEDSHDVALQHTGPNLFGGNNVVHPSSIATATFDPQFLLQHLQNLQNGEQTNDGLQSNDPQMPTYYVFSPDPAPVSENLMENAIDAAVNPMNGGEQLLGVPPGKKIVVEPLFVAMAGFVGIAMIFMSAVLFLPKILMPPPEVSGLKGPQELAALTKLAVETIEGKDCTERIACEVGRAMRSMQVGSKPIKVLEVLLPANLAKQLVQIRKAVADKKTCRLIQCKHSKPLNQKAKTVESKIVAETEPPELTTKNLNQKEKVKDQLQLTMTTKHPKPSTKVPETKPPYKQPTKETEKKPAKDQDKRLPLSKDHPEKKQPPKNEDKNKPKQTKTINSTTTEWHFLIFR